jgi:hypothetical protein
MSLLARIKNRQNLQPVIALDDNNEFDNIINAIAGVSIDKSIRVRSNDNSFAVARFDQLGTNRIAEFFKNGSERSWFDTNGNLVIQHGDVPSIFLDNSDTARSALLEATDGGLLDLESDTGNVFSIDLNTRILTFNQQPVLPSRKVWWSVNWFIADPSTFPLGSFNLAQKVSVPAGSNNFRAQFGRGIFNTGTASGSFSVEIRKHPFNNQTGQTTLGTITFNPGTVGVGQGSVAAIDHTFAADDYIYIVLTARSSPAQRDVSIALTGYQEPTV